ncbi:uncharacterized protein LOC108229666 [Kryptolebias marmoratus]|uniref:uncharacterized protein LOC108229666 n=1 Tax=Kryptolebias marmoratus TaxID=37003 RepID=UPI0018ACBA3E|nr:uncharacterized protein LOC108229666 [Kryptolebias marmoratus]
METAVTMEDHSDIEMLKKMDDLEQTLCPDKKLPKTVASQPRCSPLVRRNLREKRRGTAEKKHGLGEKRCGQKRRRRGQEEKTGGVTVKRTWSGGKRRWNKKHYCVFCRRPQVKIARHLLRKHADEQEVMAASALPTGSKERHLLLEHLRCRGNYLHNIEVIRQGSGEIIPWRQPSEEVDARNYLPCPLCLGFFLRADLWKHQVSCRKKLAIDPSRGHTSVAEIPSKSPASMTDIPSDLVTSDSTGKFSCDPEENTPEDPFGQTSNKNSKPGTKQTLTSDPGVDHNQNLDSVLNKPRKRIRVQAAASRLLPISSGASESCSEILHRMNQDNVSYEVCTSAGLSHYLTVPQICRPANLFCCLLSPRFEVLLSVLLSDCPSSLHTSLCTCWSPRFVDLCTLSMLVSFLGL